MPYDIDGKFWGYPTDQAWTKDDVNLEHALHSLSKKARFNDQLFCTAEEWNVLKHSLSLVLQALLISSSDSIGRKLVLQAFPYIGAPIDHFNTLSDVVIDVTPTDLKYLLVHDLPEAYIGDIITPFKRVIFSEDDNLFDVIDENIMMGFFDLFDVKFDKINYPLVKGLDSACVFSEFTSFGTKGGSVGRNRYKLCESLEQNRSLFSSSETEDLLSSDEKIEELTLHLAGRQPYDSKDAGGNAITSCYPLEAYFPCLLRGTESIFGKISNTNVLTMLEIQQVSINCLKGLDREATIRLFHDISNLLALWDK